MAQYKHDRFFKFYLRSLYQSKGETLQNIQVRNDEDLEIDFMFIAQSDKFGWQQEDLGLFDALMKVHPTIIIEHYSGYAQEKHIHKSITRKNLYWEPKQAELATTLKQAQQTVKYQQLSPESLQLIDNQNPFTWILTVNCSPELLELCGAKPHPEFGAGVYETVKLLRMGIVVIEQLEYSPATMWLKLLGNKESARRAFEGIEQLSPERREKNDTIRASLKYCVYLKDLPANSLSAEEQEFMKTMAEIDAWYDAEMDKAESKGEQRGKLEGKLESATRVIGVKFQGYVPTENVTSQLAALNEQQLDDLIVGMFSWQTVAQMEEWLSSVES
ncbi:hypothetical protein [Chamaesiphon sp. OTE_20_metabat_361]|uniref:hypothetical protein n=1 Tax=Chamaesiphon sp. OTE_20_metabat_361 TaxID=2964689 RepID=UPI00286A2A33|nr:hypothetical protein [Chamaesiphon sp. OTE_20_metabat_361]